MASLTAIAQTDNMEVDAALREWFKNYQQAGYRPMRAFGADSFRINDMTRQLSVFSNESFASQPFTPQNVKAIYTGLSRWLPQPYNTYRLTVYGKDGRPIEEYIPNLLREEGADRSRLWGNTRYRGNPWVRNTSLPYVVSRGLQGHHLFVTPSHGRYYKNATGQWGWQRPYLFCTTEDLFTQSIVNPFLLPMLERAGAVVFSARERDYQTAEAIVDNDSPQLQGHYSETAEEGTSWTTPAYSCGFALPAQWLTDSVHPFQSGSYRQVAASTSRHKTATATWTPRLPRHGLYAVYVSYATRPNSVPDAHYTVYHKGGRTQFSVNQQMGGGTWVYLGTFEFDEGENSSGRVVLSNQSSQRGVVTADAVRFGGGMGRHIRGTAQQPTGLPRFLEGGRAYTQWAGAPDSVFRPFNGDNDYNDDIRCRPNMLNWLCGGSIFLPTREGLRVPLETSLAVHSDAGFRHDNSFYGTLGISTTDDGNGRHVYPAGISRHAATDLANIMLTEITRDVTAAFDTAWIRRETWDRNYAESRMPEVPGIILETLSHQNFADLRYGHDPNFKFVLSRSIYKALLRFVNSTHNIKDYSVQPLPVHAFQALLSGNTAELSWLPTTDTQEASAVPSSYVVYTKRNASGFDNGQLVKGSTHLSVPIEPGVQYAFRVTAVNDGGESFPSETLSVYRAPDSRAEALIVNGFDRLSGPAYVLTPDSAGFDLKADIGVPYLCQTSFAGYQDCFDRTQEGKEGSGALGHCGTELLGKVICGNTFNYPELHGAAIAQAGGISFSSASREAAAGMDWNRFSIVDFIAGLQRDTYYNLRPYKSFDAPIRTRMEAFRGGLLVSGAFIGSDMTSEEERAFTRSVLKYEHFCSEPNDSLGVDGLRLHLPLCSGFNAEQYAVQQYDVLTPAAPDAFAAFAYSNGHPAGIAYAGSDRHVIAMGFPFESITDDALRKKAMQAMLKFLINK